MTDAEFSGQLIRDQLRSRTDKQAYYNRNTFTVRTNDDEAVLVREYCEQNGTNPNIFLRSLISQFFNNQIEHG